MFVRLLHAFVQYFVRLLNPLSQHTPISQSVSVGLLRQNNNLPYFLIRLFFNYSAMR